MRRRADAGVRRWPLLDLQAHAHAPSEVRRGATRLYTTTMLTAVPTWAAILRTSALSLVSTAWGPGVVLSTEARCASATDTPSAATTAAAVSAAWRSRGLSSTLSRLTATDRWGTAVPPGLDPDGRGDDQADRAGLSEVAGRRDLHCGKDPTVLAVGRVDQYLDSFVVEDDGARFFHAAAARPAA